jgi:hypothetical protein
MKTFTTTSARVTRNPPGQALPSSLENRSAVVSPASGQAHVLPMTKPRNRSGWRVQDRLALLVAELPADGREQPPAPVAGVGDRQPVPVISGIDRP